jgi:Smg protein
VENTFAFPEGQRERMMKENVLDVLMYLFENYMDEGPEFHPDQETLSTELAQAGFPKGEINKAFSWLEGLSSLREHNATRSFVGGVDSLRHFSALEQEKLNPEARGFLLFMEQNGMLDASARELVIDRVMALDIEEITVDQLKWVVLMVLFNQPEQDHAFMLLEDLVFDELQGHLH